MTIEPHDYPFKGTLLDHQHRALVESGLKHGHAFWVDAGGGKTGIAIAEASELYMQGKIDGVLIVAPLGPNLQWIRQQFPLWCDVDWRGIQNYDNKTNRKKFFSNTTPAMGVGTMNFEALRTKAGEEFIAEFMAKYPRIYLVGDEIQKIKDTKSAQTKKALLLSLKAEYRRALSGTPLLKGLEDLYSAYEFCQPGLAWPMAPIEIITNINGSQRADLYGFLGYRAHYCKTRPTPSGRGVIITGYRNPNQLKERVKDHATRVMSDEFMKGPKPTTQEVWTPMSATQRALYNKMQADLFVQVEGNLITAANALVQLTKLMQLASGFIIDEDRQIEWVGNNKMNAAQDLIEDLDEPLLIWTPFIALKTATMDLLKKLGRPYIEYTAQDDVKRWEDLDNGVMVGNQTSGMGVGLNLQHAAANLYVANNYSAEARWQSLKRTDRVGQTRQVRNWDLITPNTVERNVMDALDAKKEMSKMTIDALRKVLIK